MRTILLAVLALGCRKETVEVRPDNKSAMEERVKCTIPGGETVTTTIKVPARCDLTVNKTLHVQSGGALEIGAGAALHARGSAGE